MYLGGCLWSYMLDLRSLVTLALWHIVQTGSGVLRIYCGLELWIRLGSCTGNFGLNSAFQQSCVNRKEMDLNCRLTPTEI